MNGTDVRGQSERIARLAWAHRKISLVCQDESISVKISSGMSQNSAIRRSKSQELRNTQHDASLCSPTATGNHGFLPKRNNYTVYKKTRQPRINPSKNPLPVTTLMHLAVIEYCILTTNAFYDTKYNYPSPLFQPKPPATWHSATQEIHGDQIRQVSM